MRVFGSFSGDAQPPCQPAIRASGKWPWCTHLEPAKRPQTDGQVSTRVREAETAVFLQGQNVLVTLLTKGPKTLFERFTFP